MDPEELMCKIEGGRPLVSSLKGGNSQRQMGHWVGFSVDGLVGWWHLWGEEGDQLTMTMIKRISHTTSLLQSTLRPLD